MRTNLSIFFLLIAMTALSFRRTELPVKNNAPLRSTTLLDTPKYVKVLVYTVLPDQWKANIDTLNEIYSAIGREKNASIADLYQKYYLSVLGRISSGMRLDSIKIQEPKK